MKKEPEEEIKELKLSPSKVRLSPKLNLSMKIKTLKKNENKTEESK